MTFAKHVPRLPNSFVQAYYRSSADITPSRSPDLRASVPPPNVSAISHGNHLALPELRTAMHRGDEIDLASDRGSQKTIESASSETGVTYHFPTTMEPPAVTARPAERPKSSETRSVKSSNSGSPRSLKVAVTLPPGAAPANREKMPRL